MDQRSSPREPGTNQRSMATKPKSDDESVPINTQSADDSSSLTSASTTRKTTACFKCKGEFDTKYAPLIPCIFCKFRWHPGCATPFIQNHKAPYTCDKCKAKREKARSKIKEAMEESKVPKRSVDLKGGKCDIHDCATPVIHAAPGAPSLCYKHKTEQQHASAKAAPPKPPPVREPIKKAKLHPVREDGKQFLKRRKERSRGSGTSNKAARVPQTQAFQPPKGHSAFTFTTVNTQPILGSNEAGPSERIHAFHSTEAQSAFNFPPPKMGSLVSAGNDLLIDDMNQSLGSATMSESIEPPPIAEQIPAFAFMPSKRSNSARTSPEYSPPPPPQLDSNPWESASTGSNTPTQHAQHNVGQDEDHHMLGEGEIEFRDVVRELAPQHPFASPKAQNPSPTYSANAPSDDEMQIDPPDPAPEPTPRSEQQLDPAVVGTVFTTLAKNAATFDTSELDNYLLEQAKPEEPPTTKELLNQNWGNFDPRLVWERKMTPEEIKEKIKEIEARGGKKANYGIHLTAQVRKEREDNGWDRDQTLEVQADDTEGIEIIQRMEELFGCEGIANFRPGVRDGRLVMIEKLSKEEAQTGPGRRRKKREPRIFPVEGGM